VLRRGGAVRLNHIPMSPPRILAAPGRPEGRLMAEIQLWGSLAAAAGGHQVVEIEARNIAELFRKLAERYPGMQAFIDQGVAVSIDGTIYRDSLVAAAAGGGGEGLPAARGQRGVRRPRKNSAARQRDNEGFGRTRRECPPQPFSSSAPSRRSTFFPWRPPDEGSSLTSPDRRGAPFASRRDLRRWT
jgi:hypothetical protein